MDGVLPKLFRCDCWMQSRPLCLGCMGACSGVHAWADDEAIKLVKGLRAALDKIAIAKGQPAPLRPNQ